jgi:N-methylhydantoinase B
MSEQIGTVDAFTISIVRSSILAAADEMFAVTARTSQSPIIYDVLDFSVAITSAEGDVIAQAVATPAFIGMLDFNVKACIARFAPIVLAPGDVVILNDPFLSGSHLNDVAVVMPIYAQETLVAYAVSKGHWNDIGGMSFGSWGPGRTEIFQEGLQIPPVRLYIKGQRNEELVDLIRANSRLPDMCEGDMEAQVAGMRAAGRRIEDIIAKYSQAVYYNALDNILTSGAAMAKAGLSRLPQGTFRADDWLDEGGPNDSPLPVHAVVEITADSFTVDFRGNSVQLPFSLNTTYPGTVAAVRIVYMALLAPHERYNQGLVQRLSVLTDEGSVFHAVRPAATSVYWEALTYAADLVWKALAPHVPDRLGAGHFLSVVADIVAGMRDDNGAPFALVEPNPGGWGASYDEDGESALVCFADGETFASSIEIIETRYPIHVDQYALNVEGGMGHGEFRGGLGIIKDYRITNNKAEFTTDINRGVVPPWGLANGGEGTLNKVVLQRDGKPSQTLRKVLSAPLLRGDVVSIRTGGGAGYGDPIRRDPKRVLADLEDEILTVEAAEGIYSVVLKPDATGAMAVDADATSALRAERLQSRERA